MSDSILLSGGLLNLLSGAAAVVICKLLFKKSVVFNIIAVVTLPILNAVYMGMVISVLGLQHAVWASPTAVLPIIGAFYIVARMIKRPLNEMDNKVDSLIKGDLNFSFDEKMMKGGAETAGLMRKLSEHVSSLNKTAAFADHVGKGNLDAEYTLLGENDTLGNAMLNMRANLLQANAEKEERQREDERRNWATQGIAKFAELLRANNDNIEELCQSIVSNLVKYVGANQGGIFIVDDESGGNPVLELKACYAYERRKFLQKTVEMGEGLVGTCFLERESAYLTNIPKEYISITSGLGEDTPRALLIVPLKVNEVVYGVVEIAAFNEFEPHMREFVEKVSESIASTIGSAKVYIRTNKLLEKTRLQAEEMSNQEEQLRQNMEEMQATQDEMRRREDEMSHVLSENKDQLTKMRLIVEAAKIGLWDMHIVKGDPVNPNNTFNWSDEFRKMLGFSSEAEFPNVLHSWSDRLHPEDKELTLNTFAQHLLDRTGQTPYDIEYRLLKKNGEYAWFHAFGATDRDEKGYALHVLGAIEEITDQQQFSHLIKNQ